jgi:hypothetical protein
MTPLSGHSVAKMCRRFRFNNAIARRSRDVAHVQHGLAQADLLAAHSHDGDRYKAGGVLVMTTGVRAA